MYFPYYLSALRDVFQLFSLITFSRSDPGRVFSLISVTRDPQLLTLQVRWCFYVFNRIFNTRSYNVLFQPFFAQFRNFRVCTFYWAFGGPLFSALGLHTLPLSLVITVLGGYRASGHSRDSVFRYKNRQNDDFCRFL